MEVIEPNWSQTFYDLAQNSKTEIDIVSPFIGKDAVDKLLNIIDTDEIHLKILTRFNERLFKAKTSSIKAIKNLANNDAKLFMLKKLNAKIYCFDQKEIIITSSNFTKRAFNEGNEYGILISKTEDDDFNYIRKKVEKFIESGEKIKDILIDETYQRVKNANEFNIHKATKYDADQGKDYKPTKIDIELVDDVDKEKVNRLVIEINEFNSKFEKYSDELKNELENSNYKNISPEMYIWLIVWSNTGGAYKKTVPKVKKLCNELFGYQSDNKIEISGKELNLKEYRYEKLPENIRKLILKYHYQCKN
ncbi:MAG: phospholipase D family protein [Bacillota bacterium]